MTPLDTGEGVKYDTPTVEEEIDMTTHLNALEVRLSHERVRLAQAKTQTERALRQVWVHGIEKEIAAERKFLGMPDELPESEYDVSDDELLEALRE